MRTVTENYTWRQYGRQVAEYLKEAVEKKKRIKIIAPTTKAHRTPGAREFLLEQQIRCWNETCAENQNNWWSQDGPAP